MKLWPGQASKMKFYQFNTAELVQIPGSCVLKPGNLVVRLALLGQIDMA